MFIKKGGRLLGPTPPRCFVILTINSVLSLHIEEHCKGAVSDSLHVCVCLEGLWVVFERSLRCIVAFWQTNAPQVATLFGLTGRFCGIARPLLIHGTVAVPLCLPWRWLICLRHGGEVNSPWKEKKKYAPGILLNHSSLLCVCLVR